MKHMGVRERPSHGDMAFSRRLIFPCLTRLYFATLASFGWRDMNSVLAIRRENAMKSGEIDSGFWHQSCQLCNKVNRLKYHMSGAIAIRCLEFIATLAGEVRDRRCSEMAGRVM